MTARTHDLAALTALNLYLATQPIPSFSVSTGIVSIFACFIGGLTPDLDEPTSEFWQKIPIGSIIGRVAHPFLGKHRFISHSILGLALLGLLVKYLLSISNQVILVDMEIVWWAFMIGYLSHLIMDSFTIEGVPWLFPIPIHFGFPPFKILRLKTGGILEKAVVFPGLLLLDGYLIYTFYPIYLSLLRSLTT